MLLPAVIKIFLFIEKRKKALRESLICVNLADKNPINLDNDNVEAEKLLWNCM